MSDHDRGRLVLGPHQRQRGLLAEVAPPDVPDPVRVGVLERTLGERREQRLDPVGDAPEDGVREGDGALEPGPADELDRLVHRRVARDAVEEAELVRAEPERGEHGRVELPHRPLAERLDRVVERAGALDGAERELPRERPVAVVEPRSRRCAALGRRRRRPRRRAAGRRTRRASRRRDRAHGRRATTWKRCQCFGSPTAVRPSSSTSSSCSTSSPSSSAPRAPASGTSCRARTPNRPGRRRAGRRSDRRGEGTSGSGPGPLECGGRAERQRQARVDDLHLALDLVEARDDGLERTPRATASVSRRARSRPLGVDREDAPAAAQQLERVPSGPAAKVDGGAGARPPPRERERLQQRLARSRRRRVVARPRAARSAQAPQPLVVAHLAPPSGCTSTGTSSPSSSRAFQIVTRRPCSSPRAPMCGESARIRFRLSSGRERSSSRSAASILAA